MKQKLEDFLNQLAPTNFRLKDYVDFEKCLNNVKKIEIRLNQLNYLIGKTDLDTAIEELYNESPKCFSALLILIAVRKEQKKYAINENLDFVLVSDYLNSLEGIKNFIHKSGLDTLFINKNIKNLVDYVFGVEVGLDTNSRKNRSGIITEDFIADVFEKSDIPFLRQYSSTLEPNVQKAIGKDKKDFDFMIKTKVKTYLIEVNFYSTQGSKLNETARSYKDLGPIVNGVQGYEFVWITDGIGWFTSLPMFTAAYEAIPTVYNFTTLQSFLDKIKSEL